MGYPRILAKVFERRAPLAVGLMLTVTRPSCEASSPRAVGVGSTVRTTASPLLPIDPALHVEAFESGVKYLSQPVPTDRKGLVMGLVVHVGSLAEREDERGIAHFVEHMAFAGTEHFPDRKLLAFLDRAGFVFGADTLAQTDYRFTSYFLELSDDDSELLDQAALILADWASGIRFAPEAVEKERAVILAEKRLRNTARGRIRERQNTRWLSGSRYAERAPIGVDAVLESVSPERLERFYRRWYHPGNFTVVVSGEFEVGAMRERIAQHFAALPPAAKPAVMPQPTLVVQPGDHFELEADSEQQFSAVAVGLQRAATGLLNEGNVRQRLIDSLITSMLQRRVEGLPASSGAAVLNTSAQLAWGEVGMFDSLQLQAVYDDGVEKALAALLGELERVARQGFSEREFEQGRAAMVRARAEAQKSRSSLRQQAAGAARRLVLQQAVPSPSQEDEVSGRLLKTITVEEVNRAATGWVRDGARQVLVVEREPARLPTEASLRALVARVRQAPIASPVDEAAAPLMAALPTAGSVTSEQELEGIAAHVWTLDNGARVVFKRMDSEAGKLSLRASSPGGTYGLQGSDLTNALASALVVSQIGLGPHSAAATRDLLAEAGVQMSPWISDYEQGLRGAAYVTGLEPFFQAIHLFLTAPGRDTGAFELQRRRLREVWEHRLADPNAYFQSAIDSRVWKNNPRYTLPAPEAADELQLEKIRSIYLDRFSNVANFTFVLVGDAQPAALTPLIERYLASLPGGAQRGFPAKADATLRPGITRIRVKRDSGEEKVSVSFHGDDPLPPSAWYDLDALSEYLDIRLREALRQRLGGTYSVEVWFSLRPPPRQGYELGFRFDCKPGQSQALKQAAFDVVRELQRHGAEPHYVDALRSKRERTAAAALRSAGFWLQELEEVYRRHLDTNELTARITSTAHISRAALQRSGRQFLRMNQYVDAVMTPR